MTRKQVTGRELARRLHVSSQWISQRTRAVVPLDADDMELVADALGITVVELISDAAQRVANAPDQSAVSRRYPTDSTGVVVEFPLVRALRPGLMSNCGERLDQKREHRTIA